MLSSPSETETKVVVLALEGLFSTTWTHSPDSVPTQLRERLSLEDWQTFMEAVEQKPNFRCAIAWFALVVVLGVVLAPGSLVLIWICFLIGFVALKKYLETQRANYARTILNDFRPTMAEKGVTLREEFGKVRRNARAFWFSLEVPQQAHAVAATYDAVPCADAVVLELGSTTNSTATNPPTLTAHPCESPCT